MDQFGGGGNTAHVSNNWNITTPNPDSFARSQRQIQAEMQRSAGQAYSHFSR